MHRYHVEYTAEDWADWDRLSKDQQAERLRVEKFSAKTTAQGFCLGVEAAGGTIIKTYINITRGAK